MLLYRIKSNYPFEPNFFNIVINTIRSLLASTDDSCYSSHSSTPPRSTSVMSLRLACRSRCLGSKWLSRHSTLLAPPSAPLATATTVKLDEYWMPFTHNRSFKQKPKMLHRAEGPFYYLEVSSILVAHLPWP